MKYTEKDLAEKFGLAPGVEIRGLAEHALARFKFGLEEISITEIKKIVFNEEHDCYEFHIENFNDFVSMALPENVDIASIKDEDKWFPVSEEGLSFLRPLGIAALPESFDMEAGMVDSEDYTIPLAVVRSLIPFYELMQKQKEEYGEFLDYESLGIKIDEDVTISIEDLGILIKSSDIDRK